MKPLFDEVARRRIKEDLDSTLVVEAAAGTGKTTELVGRDLSLLASGKASRSRIVAVTFTEKAAGEMKLRLRSEIEKARAGAPFGGEVRARLDAALDRAGRRAHRHDPRLLRRLLRERPVEARVDPQFEVAAEDEKERLYGNASSAGSRACWPIPPRGCAASCEDVSRDRDALGPRLILEAGGQRSHRAT